MRNPLAIDRTSQAVLAGLGDKEVTLDIMLAAIEGVAIGQAYVLGIKTNSHAVSMSALSSLVDGYNRYITAEKLNLV